MLTSYTLHIEERGRARGAMLMREVLREVLRFVEM